MKVLFIDDEPIVRKGLQVIIPWQEYGYEICGEAEDGTIGIEMILNLQPDLVLLDIRMQEISGLDLAKEVREKGFTGKIIILSGYSDFEYAKTAILYDVTAYLLKPVDTKELINIIIKAKEEIEKEKIISVYSDQSIRHTKEVILSNLIQGKIEYQPDTANLYGVDLNDNLFELISIQMATKPDENSTDSLFIHQLKKAFSYSSIINGSLYFILNGKEKIIEFRRLIQSFLKKEKIMKHSFIIVSQTVTSPNNLKLLYHEIQNINENIYFYQTSFPVLYAAEIEKCKQEVALMEFSIIDIVQNLINCILANQNKKLDTILDSMEYFQRYKEVSSQKFGFLIVNCYMQVKKAIEPHYPQIKYNLPDYDAFLEKFYPLSSLYKGMIYLKKLFHEMQNEVAYCSGNNVMVRICQYIEANYNKQIKLEHISSIFGYNSSYLGKIFSKYIGNNFNTYLDGIRINHAKDMLNNGIAVHITAYNCGFNDLDYFSKKFKKLVGCPPSEYKKNNHSGEQTVSIQ